MSLSADNIKQIRKNIDDLANADTDDEQETTKQSLYTVEQQIDEFGVHITTLLDTSLTELSKPGPDGNATREAVLEYNTLRQVRELVGVASEMVIKAREILNATSGILYLLYLTKESAPAQNAPRNAPPGPAEPPG